MLKVIENRVAEIIIITIMLLSITTFGQTQCKGNTKNNVQCKNITKKENSLCHNHDENHVSEDKNKIETVICSGTTKQNKPCKRKTKDKSGKCYNHRKK
tara:strand:- start:247 stop:543 length:297 start_codon:yes stop_codon:yes gene_type:complete